MSGNQSRPFIGYYSVWTLPAVIKYVPTFNPKALDRLDLEALFRVFRITVLLLIVSYLFCSDPVKRLNNSLIWKTDDEPKKPDLHAFVISSYYYPVSQSLGNNSVAILLSSNYDYHWQDAKLQVLGYNETENVVAWLSTSRVTPHNICRLITVFGTAQLMPNLKKLYVIMEDRLVDIPFTVPQSTKRDVVFCISPLFVSEQWQNFLFAVHTYRRFGAHMHIYVVSAVKAFYELIKKYEENGYLTLQPWLRAKINATVIDNFDPNSAIEFRNQAAAQSDCLLQYKETATFIAFLDLDDVLIPRIGPDYVSEFVTFFHSMPFVAFLAYAKENSDIDAADTFDKFSFQQTFSTLRFSGKKETGKIVTRPSLLNSTWIHWPSEMPTGMDKYNVTTNSITHLKNIYLTDRQKHNDRIPTVWGNATSPLMSAKDIVAIELDFKQMASRPDVQEICSRLPKEQFYLSLVSKCFQEKYYYYHYSNRIREITCPGPHMCTYPQRDDVECVHSDAIHTSTKKSYPLWFHYTSNPTFVTTRGCFP